MSARDDLLTLGRPVGENRSWPRIAVDRDGWAQATFALAERDLVLVALWGEADGVAMALMEEATGEGVIAALTCDGGRYPSVGLTHPPALRLERTIRDLFGHEAEGSPDRRPWTDHGRWGVRAPLGAAEPVETGQAPYAFLPVEGPPMHQIPVGPVHAGIIEPGHFRFTASGETVVRLEARFGWVHKGIEGLMRGASIERAARLAARVSGDATVAWSFAFAQAVEAASGTVVPARAMRLRALAAELERVANHLGDFGAICNDAAFAMMLNQTGQWRERVLRAIAAAFGHRLAMDAIVPGGMAVDLGDAAGIKRLVDDLERAFPALATLYDETVSLQNRTVGTGVLAGDLAAAWAVGGVVGRASGRRFDARRLPGYAPYDDLRFDVALETAGDVDARVRVRLREIETSLKLVRQLVDGLPGGAIRVEVVPGTAGAEGVGLVESFRGDVFVRVRLDGAGGIAEASLRDPSVFQWPLIEAAIEGNIVADFPLINKSFNCSYSGHDL